MDSRGPDKLEQPQNQQGSANAPKDNEPSRVGRLNFLKGIKQRFQRTKPEVPQGTVPPEKNTPEQTVMVDLGNGRMGHEIKNPGQSFGLGNMFSPDASILGGDKFAEVYFRTKSGNIYVLNDHGALVNGDESEKERQSSGQERSLFISALNPNDLQAQKLEIGKPFRYGNKGSTSNIVEIIPSTYRIYAEDYLKDLTSEKTNRIMTNFRAKAPGYSYTGTANVPNIRP